MLYLVTRANYDEAEKIIAAEPKLMFQRIMLENSNESISPKCIALIRGTEPGLALGRILAAKECWIVAVEEDLAILRQLYKVRTEDLKRLPPPVRKNCISLSVSF